MRETQPLPNVADTLALGRTLATRLAPLAQARGALLLLEGTLGAGKTTLVRGMVEALGGIGRVSSPTFALLHEYPLTSPDLDALIHLDAYRLDGRDAFDAAVGGLEELLQPRLLVVVEWPSRVGLGLGGEADCRVEIEHAQQGRLARLDWYVTPPPGTA